MRNKGYFLIYVKKYDKNKERVKFKLTNKDNRCIISSNLL